MECWGWETKFKRIRRLEAVRPMNYKCCMQQMWPVNICCKHCHSHCPISRLINILQDSVSHKLLFNIQTNCIRLWQSLVECCGDLIADLSVIFWCRNPALKYVSSLSSAREARDSACASMVWRSKTLSDFIKHTYIKNKNESTMMLRLWSPKWVLQALCMCSWEKFSYPRERETGNNEIDSAKTVFYKAVRPMLCYYCEFL